MVDTLSRFAKRNSEDSFWDSVIEYLGPLDARLERIVKRALREAREGMDADRIAELIQTGDYDRAVALALGTNSGDPTLFMALRVAIDEAALRTMTHLSVDGIGTVQVPRVLARLDTVPKESIDAIQNETMASVTQVTNTTKQGLRAVLEEGVKQGQNPRVTARDMRDMIGLTDRDALAVMRYRKELQNYSRAALQRELRNRRFDSMIRRGDYSQQKIEQMVEDYRNRLIKHRAETIARTEAARAFNIGQHELWVRITQDKGLPPSAVRRFWTVAPGERTCEICKDIKAMNIDGVALNEPFQTPAGPLDLPPYHPNCRCSVIVTFDLASAIRALERKKPQ